MLHSKTLHIAFILFILAFNAHSQSISINFSFITRCSEDTLSIPIVTTGTFSAQSQYTVTFIGIDYAQTFTTSANRIGDKLFIKLPRLISSSKYADKYALQVSSTNPNAVSGVSNSHISISYQTWAAMVSTGTGSLNSNTVIANNHINPGDELKLFINNKGHWDEGLKVRLRGGYVNNTPYISEGIVIRPSRDTTYKLLSVSTTMCGNGIIQGNDSLSVTVNPFALMISQVSPTIVCPNQKFLIHFSSSGSFGFRNQFQLQLQTDNGTTYNIPSTPAGKDVLSAILPTNIAAGYYNVRIISNAPTIYSSFGRIKISPLPSINISTYPVSLRDSISYGESISLQLGFVGEPLFSVRLNDSIAVLPNNYSNAWASIGVSPKQTTTYYVTNFETACGNTSNINASKTIYVRDEIILDSIPKKYYCQGEIIRMKFHQKGSFAPDNRFIVQLKQYNGYIDLNTQTVGDSVFIIVPNQNFDYTYENGFNLRIKSTNPQIYGSISPNTFFIKRKPSAKILPYFNNTPTPDFVTLKVDVSGHRPYTLKLSDGKTYNIASNSFIEMRTQEEAFVKVFVPQTATYSITELSNDCGSGTSSGSQTIQVTQPSTPTIRLQKDYGSSPFCKGQTYEISLYTVGNFGSNNIFIAEIGQYNSTNRIEIGRSTTNTISVTMPTNINTENFLLYIKSTTPSIDIYTNIRITVLPSANIQYASPDLTFDGGNYLDTIRILKNEQIRFGINISGASGPYNIDFSNSTRYTPLLNSAGNPYLNQDIQYFTFNFAKSQLFSISHIANSCGVGTITGNSRYVSIVPLRIISKIRYTEFETTVCESTNFFVPYEVEGYLPKKAILGVQIAKQNTNNFIDLPIIAQNNPIEVNIPMGFEEGYYSIRVICKNCADGKYIQTNGIRIKHQANVSLKLQNNLDTLSINGGQTVQLKLLLTGTPDFKAILNDETQYNISSLEYLISKTPFTSQTYRINNLSNSCGYVISDDSVRVKVRNKLLFSLNNTDICRNKVINISYSIYGDYSSNNSTKFILVANNGMIWELKNITNNQGTTSLQLPSNIPLGAYSLRLITSSPILSYSVNVNIIDTPIVELQGNATVVQGETTALKVKLISPTLWQTANYEMSDGLVSSLGGGYMGYATVSIKPATITSTLFIRTISNSCGIGSSTGNSVITVIPKSTSHSIQLGYNGNICKGTESQIYFSRNGIFGANNIFKLFLSDKNGDNFVEIPSEYTSPTNIIKAKIPYDLELGNNYRFMVKSTDPEVSSSSSSPISSFNAPSASFIDTVYFVPTNGVLLLKVKITNPSSNNLVWITLNNSSSSTGIIGSTGTIYFSSPEYKFQTFKITKVNNSECNNGIIDTPFVARVCNESLKFISNYYSGYRGSYQTEKGITISSNINDTNINFNAGTSVLLLPGFKFTPTINSANTQFSAQINGCVR